MGNAKLFWVIKKTIFIFIYFLVENINYSDLKNSVMLLICCVIVFWYFSTVIKVIVFNILFWIFIDNFKSVSITRMEPYMKNGNTYLRIKDFKFKFTTSRLHLKLDNLFNGDKALGESFLIIIWKSTETPR